MFVATIANFMFRTLYLFVGVHKTTREILYCENFDLENVITPVNVDRLENLLRATNYDPVKTNKIIHGLRHGFDLGYEGPENVQITAPNLKFRGVGDEIDLWNTVMKEVKLKRYAGPFESIPFDTYIQSPIGLVPKDNGRDTRLIFHLSYLRGKQKKSVNANTPEEECTVQYPLFDEAIRLCIKAGKGCKLSHSDVQSAFRNLGMNKKSWHHLVMRAKLPINGKWYYFVDKCLPFGASISCKLFQMVSDALAYLVQNKTGDELVNYLDDFLFIALLACICNQNLEVFLELCRNINMPISEEKTEGASTCLVFLGLLINTIDQTVSVPIEKLEKAQVMISNILGRPSKKITVNELQKLCGFLNFLCRAVLPGRAFTRRLYAQLGGNINKSKLLPHHHIRINTEVRQDLLTWEKFINHPSAFCRSFIDFTETIKAEEIGLASDASRAHTLGFGAICQTSWIYHMWLEGYIASFKPSIEYLELFGVVAGVIQWIHRFRNKRIILLCDNTSVVAMINNMTTSCKNCMKLLRLLILKGMVVNVRIFARYVSSKNNYYPDLLSRGKIQTFKDSGLFEVQPTEVPKELWPIDKLWIQ